MKHSTMRKLTLLTSMLVLFLFSCSSEETSDLAADNSEISISDEIQEEGENEDYEQNNLAEDYNCDCEGKGLKINDIKSIPSDFTGYFYVCYKDTCVLEMSGAAIKGMRATKNDDLEVYYYPNGQIKATGRVWEDKTIGEWKFFYPNGQLSAQGNMIDNCKRGKWVEYYENGQVSMDVQYSDYDCLILNGKRTEYFESGQIWAIGQYSNNTPYGEHITYYENGQIKSKGTYKNGNKDNDWIYYHKDGTPSDNEVF